MLDINDQNALWDDPVRDYRQRYQLPDQFLWDEASLARIDFDGYMLTVLSLLPGKPADVLDAGCGPGLGVKLMGEKGYQVTGVDYNDRGIAFAKILVPEARFYHHDLRLLREIKEFQAAFDAVTIIEVIEHIPAEFHKKLLESIHSVLCSKGTLILSVPSAGMPMNTWDYKHFTQDEITDLIESVGFTTRKIVYQHQLHWLFAGRTWRFLTNQYYDLRFVRQLLRRAFLKTYNTTDDPNRAGRYIIQAEKST
jgi:2-polyprenyl-3-methyl-5-hydroxy-6-metoxy-1,4-benzoquinol methylase